MRIPPERLRWWWFQRSLFRAQRLQRPPDLDAVLDARRVFDGAGELVTLPESVRREAVDIGGIAGEWLRDPAFGDDAVVLYVHGGAYTIGSIVAGRGAAHVVARATRLPTLHVDYRLAPEHPFPAGRDDVVAAYRWLLGAGHRAERIVVAGDSAGGGLALAALLAARADGLPMPAGLVATSTWADLGLRGASYADLVDRDPVLRPAFLRLCADLYVPGGVTAHPAADVLTADLAGLPPLLLMVGADEIVLDDTATIARRARDVGVDVRVHVAAGRVHCWTGYVDRFPSIQADLDVVAAFCDDVLGRGATAHAATESRSEPTW